MGVFGTWNRERMVGVKLFMLLCQLSTEGVKLFMFLYFSSTEKSNFSAEAIALSLLSQFSEKRLPKASELDWLVSEKDVPQAVSYLSLLPAFVRNFYWVIMFCYVFLSKCSFKGKLL